VSASLTYQRASATHELAGVALLREDGAALLQLRDNKPGLSDAGMWVFPGGHCQKEENPEACARREFEEETAYRCEDLRFFAAVSSPVDGKERQLTFFCQRFDGKQGVRCLEGQAIKFWRREDAPANVPGYLLEMWDLALAALPVKS
jgi:8-oxo-dGTP pyrophosphatase MutT (NUDIX family)